ncbi:retrovirus-related pol polyprotein from transposon TNT 1-94 [Tanacetum coccineum]
MGIPNEHQLKFNSIKDAKSLLQAVKKSSEVLDQTFDRLQKLISQLEIHGESISQEDVNQKFLRSLQPNSPQLDNEDLQQIHPDDLKEMDLRWQMAILTMRERRFLKNTRRKLIVNGNETIGFDKNRENTRRVVPVEITTSNALVSCDGSSYDWSDQAEKGPTNFALMAYSSTSSNSEVSNDSNCSSSCLENVKILKEQNEQLLKDLRTSKLNAIAYKTCLESVEARLLVYKKNESVYEEDIKVLKCEIHLREVAIIKLRRKLELAQKQKDEIHLTVENFENSSKNLSKLIDYQIVDKCKTGLGYNAVPPPYTGNFMPPKPDLSFSGLEEFTSELVVIKLVVENSKAKASKAKPKAIRKNNGAPIIEDWVSESEEEDVPQTNIENQTVKPSFDKIELLNLKEKLLGKLSIVVNTVKDKNVNTVRPKAVVYVARPKVVVNAVKGNNVNVVKASACWVWKPKTKVLDHVSKHNSASITLKKFDYVDAQGRSKTEAVNMGLLCATKVDEVYFVGYSINSKAFRVSTIDTRHSTKACDDAGDDEKKVTEELGKEGGDPSKGDERDDQEKDASINSTNNVNAASINEVNVVGRKASIELPDEPNMLALEDTVYSDDHEDVGAEANINNLDAFMPMDVKSAFLYGKIEEEVYVCQPPGFEDSYFYDRVYKVEKALYGLHQAPRAWYETLSTYLLDNGIQRGKIDKTLLIRRDSSMGELTFFLGLQVKQKEDGIFISQDKYVTEILKKFGFTDVKTASTPMETQKLLLKDEDGEEVDVHLYRSMIGSLMYLTSSRPDIMFAVCACARYQVNPKVSHLHAVKRIFRYLKGQPKLGLWYPKDSPFDLVAYTDSDYAGASLDRKSTTGVNAARRNLLLLLKVNAARHNLLLLLKVNAARHKLTTTVKMRRLLHGMSLVAYGFCILLATNQKFNFSKYIFESMVKNLDNAGKFLMYPRVVQVFLDKQLKGMQSHKRIYVTPSHTKKTFGNMRRVGKGFSRRDTPLFPTMIVQAQQEQGKGSTMPTDPQHTPTIIQPSTSQPQLKQRSGRPKRKDTGVPQPSGPTTNVVDEAVNKEMDDSLERAATTATSLHAEQDMVKKLEKKRRSRTHKLKRLYKVSRSAKVISFVEVSLGDQEDASKQGKKIDDIDKDAEFTLVDETQVRYGDEDMFRLNDLKGDEVIVETEVASKDVNLSVDEVTLAQALAALKSAKPKANKVMLQEPEKGTITTTTDAITVTTTSTRPKAKGLVIHEEEQATTPTVSSQQPSQVKAHKKGKMFELEPVKKLSKKDQLMLDEELAFKLQDEEEEKDRLVRQREEEANIVSWDNVQAMIDVAYQMAQ